jgi:hypothetical protein
MKNHFKFSLPAYIKIFFIFYFLFFSFPVQAATSAIPHLEITIPELKLTELVCTTDKDGNGSCSIDWIGKYIQALYNYGLGIAGILAAIMMMVGGVLWTTAGGNQQRVTEAKSYIVASITGVALLLGAYTILYEINPDLVNLKNIIVKKIKFVPVEEDAKFTSGGGNGDIPSNQADRDKYDADLTAYSRTARIDCTLLKAILFTESSGNPNAESASHAKGLTQVIDSTAQEIGCGTNLFDPKTSIECGAKYIAHLELNACNGKEVDPGSRCDTANMDNIIAAYNGGPGANKESRKCPNVSLWRCEEYPGYQQTREYVKKVKANYQKLKDADAGC